MVLCGDPEECIDTDGDNEINYCSEGSAWVSAPGFEANCDDGEDGACVERLECSDSCDDSTVTSGECAFLSTDAHNCLVDDGE